MWTTYETCSYKLSDIKDRPFIGFDFDDTLVKLRTNEPLPNVKDKLEELYRDFNIVIFSNQNGVQKGKCTHELVRNNFDTFISKVNLPISVFYSIGNDIYRKPNIGMFTLFKQTCNKPLEWYCGDACGRRKDFSNSDLYFANNCGIQLKTPEHTFNSQDNTISIVKCSELYSDDTWVNGLNTNSSKLIETYEKDIELSNDKKVLILMMGAQGSGKSLISERLAKRYNYNVISSDNIPSKSKLKQQLKKYIALEQGIIIDNTNASLRNREEWYRMVDESWKKVVIYINIPKPVSFHLVKYRETHTDKHIPNVAVHSFYKRLEPPTDKEGHIIEINKPIVIESFNHNLRFT